METRVYICFVLGGTNSMMATYFFHIGALVVWWLFLLLAFFHGTDTPYLSALHDLTSAALASITVVVPEAVVHTACLLLGWISTCDLYSVKAMLSAALMLVGVLSGAAVESGGTRSVLMTIGAGGAVGIRLQTYGVFAEWKRNKLNKKEPRLPFDYVVCVWFLVGALCIGFVGNIAFAVCSIIVPNEWHDYLLFGVLCCAIVAEMFVTGYVYWHRKEKESENYQTEKGATV